MRPSRRWIFSAAASSSRIIFKKSSPPTAPLEFQAPRDSKELTRIANMLARKPSQPDKIINLIKRCTEEGVQIDRISCYTSLILAYANKYPKPRSDLAQKTFNQLHQDETSVPTDTANALLRAYAAESPPKIDKMKHLVEGMASGQYGNRCAPNKFSFGLLLDTFYRYPEDLSADLAFALVRILDWMKRLGFHADEYHLVAAARVLASRTPPPAVPERTEVLLQWMGEQRLKPFPALLSAMISAFARARNFEGISWTLEQMQLHNIDPDINLIETIVTSFCADPTRENLDEALRVLNQLEYGESYAARPTITMYSSVLRAISISDPELLPSFVTRLIAADVFDRLNPQEIHAALQHVFSRKCSSAVFHSLIAFPPGEVTNHRCLTFLRKCARLDPYFFLQNGVRAVTQFCNLGVGAAELGEACLSLLEQTKHYPDPERLKFAKVVKRQLDALGVATPTSTHELILLLKTRTSLRSNEIQSFENLARIVPSIDALIRQQREEGRMEISHTLFESLVELCGETSPPGARVAEEIETRRRQCGVELTTEFSNHLLRIHTASIVWWDKVEDERNLGEIMFSIRAIRNLLENTSRKNLSVDHTILEPLRSRILIIGRSTHGRGSKNVHVS